MSRQISSLERQVGAALFRRMPNGMMTTYAGERLEPMARDLVRRGRRERDVMTGIVQEQCSFIVAASGDNSAISSRRTSPICIRTGRTPPEHC
ncbi:MULTISPECIES: LysR family transcriptional regulator [Microbacterium]|uniref:LysR family transcriptional regulator n=1 Tax=Microbacterium TaxID=33882 RepID=UPI00051A060D|nr:LysR family transcriptional regulator [Microbacterium profundi]